MAIKASMNLGLSDELKSAFPDITPAIRPDNLSTTILSEKKCVGFLLDSWFYFRWGMFLY